MTTTVELSAMLRVLRAAVARSPIVVQRLPQDPVPDWATVRKSADADALILAWLAGHVQPRRRREMH